ncbi:type II methionyl aminopeptidase [Candidatus Micrarchaeota archaeon]|nr:type II methionyl aminopeptidase [Candidatus Micrarchaeota archaeon]
MEDSLDQFIEAGKLGSKIREESRRLIIVDESLLDIAETIEQMIMEEGAKPAFPVNLSINEIAAHYTPESECNLFLKESDLIKVDIGVELNGGLADTAYSMDLSGKKQKLIESTEQALGSAINFMKAGIKVGDIGGIIEDKIKSYGFNPISNLTGHLIKTNDLHAGVEIPNVRSKNSYQLKVGEIFAVEPFATTGEGYVSDMEQVEIFGLYAPNQIRMRQSRRILQYALDNYGMLPFAERWIRKQFNSKILVNTALREMLASQVIKGYPVLREKSGGVVAQTEHTVLIEEDHVKILTK